MVQLLRLGGGKLAVGHVASARSFAVRGALPAGGDSVAGDGGTSVTVAGCEVEAGVTAPQSGPGSLSWLSVPKVMKQTGALKAVTLYFAS